MNIFGITKLFPPFLYKRDSIVHLSNQQPFTRHHNNYPYALSITIYI